MLSWYPTRSCWPLLGFPPFLSSFSLVSGLSLDLVLSGTSRRYSKVRLLTSLSKSVKYEKWRKKPTSTNFTANNNHRNVRKYKSWSYEHRRSANGRTDLRDFLVSLRLRSKICEYNSHSWVYGKIHSKEGVQVDKSNVKRWISTSKRNPEGQNDYPVHTNTLSSTKKVWYMLLAIIGNSGG